MYKIGLLTLLQTACLLAHTSHTTEHATNSSSIPTHDSMDNFMSTVHSAIVRRAAFDIGSLTTKMIVADIDTETNKIVRVLLKDVRRVGYKYDLERPESDGTFTKALIQEGVQGLRELKAQAEKLTPVPTEYVAVATAALRAGLNSKEVVSAIKEELDIPVYIINQEEEARLGFNGAINAAQADATKALVWDTGGGSMQIIVQDDATLLTHGSELGFIAFARKVMSQIQNKELDTQATPNPLSKEDADKAIELATKLALKLPPFIQEKAKAPLTRAIGIGALYYATHGQSSDALTDTFTQDDIRSLLTQKLGKTDEELRSVTHKAIPTLVSATALALIVGFMKGLGLENLTTIEVNMTDALLVDEHYFKHKQT